MTDKSRPKGRKWDGISRVPTNKYRKRWDEIFNKQKEIEEKLWSRLKEWNEKK